MPGFTEEGVERAIKRMKKKHKVHGMDGITGDIKLGAKCPRLPNILLR